MAALEVLRELQADGAWPITHIPFYLKTGTACSTGIDSKKLPRNALIQQLYILPVNIVRDPQNWLFFFPRLLIR